MSVTSTVSDIVDTATEHYLKLTHVRNKLNEDAGVLAEQSKGKIIKTLGLDRSSKGEYRYQITTFPCCDSVAACIYTTHLDVGPNLAEEKRRDRTNCPVSGCMQGPCSWQRSVWSRDGSNDMNSQISNTCTLKDCNHQEDPTMNIIETKEFTDKDEAATYIAEKVASRLTNGREAVSAFWHRLDSGESAKWHERHPSGFSTGVSSINY
ncbi:uncharacterized protein I206_105363 [Kwoniella pini CBS 10737]|uniref:Uncharacterized protein n=1 Tax=Kwoniella pini CBS 10737 TaxID=1296096 RepID=A0A1B9I4F8_9TREE|nr:uncharacterized protein I206_03728 [Kwoniella pini CBS 10737]OCF50406.1 hypothetical protein I206_03728 [Kwoniella pini CBS 10737]